MLGHLLDGVQAEDVRVPFAQNSLYPLPETVADEAALLLADVLPTSYEVGVLNGRIRPGQSVVAVGVPETFELCVEIVRAGGRVANVGVHGSPI